MRFNLKNWISFKLRCDDSEKFESVKIYTTQLNYPEFESKVMKQYYNRGMESLTKVDVSKESWNNR